MSESTAVAAKKRRRKRGRRKMEDRAKLNKLKQPVFFVFLKEPGDVEMGPVLIVLTV